MRALRPPARVRIGFLWMPRTINGRTKWLCRARWKEVLKRVSVVYRHPDGRILYTGIEHHWVPICWRKLR